MLTLAAVLAEMVTSATEALPTGFAPTATPLILTIRTDGITVGEGVKKRCETIATGVIEPVNPLLAVEIRMRPAPPEFRNVVVPPEALSVPFPDMIGAAR
jgi:hypothetical protein